MTTVYLAAFVVGAVAVRRDAADGIKATEAAATPLAEIERLSIIGGASDTQDAVGGLLGVSPLAVAKIVEALKSSGIDLPAMLNRTTDVTTNGQPETV